MPQCYESLCVGNYCGIICELGITESVEFDLIMYRVLDLSTSLNVFHALLLPKFLVYPLFNIRIHACSGPLVLRFVPTPTIGDKLFCVY